MKKKLRYGFSRLIVLIIAIRILDVSIDTDHITAASALVNVESYDDTDSFSELLIETIAGNDNLIAETGTDDHAPAQKRLHKTHSFVFYNADRHLRSLMPFSKPADHPQVPCREAFFRQDDFSMMHYPPPEQPTLTV